MPSEVCGDPLRLRQVISNLANNALKFTKEGEVIIGVRVRDRGPWHINLEIRVSDTGMGVPEERTESIFRPFSQADASTTRKYGGTGLGLPICRQLVELMGGNLQLKSTVGQGSTFFFEARFELEEKLSEELKSRHRGTRRNECPRARKQQSRTRDALCTTRVLGHGGLDDADFRRCVEDLSRLLLPPNLAH